MNPFVSGLINLNVSITLSLIFQVGLEGRHSKVLATELKNRRRLKSINYVEEVRLEQRMRTLKTDLQAEVLRHNRAMNMVNRRLIDIKAYQEVLSDKYAFTESNQAESSKHITDFKLKTSVQTLKRQINQKKRELDPIYQHNVMRSKHIARLKKESKVTPIDRNLSSLTTILETYSKPGKPGLLKPKGVIVTVSEAKRSQSFTELATKMDELHQSLPSFRSEKH